jgi:hypothetical protein
MDSKARNGLDQLFQVFEPGRRVGGAVVLPHLGVAGFLEDGFGELVAGGRLHHALPAGEHLDHVGQRLARLWLEFIGEDQFARGGEHGDAAGAGDVVDLAHRRFAQAALGDIDDALEGEIVGGLGDNAEERHGIADFLAFVKARAADDAVIQPQRDEAFLELAHLEGGADQDRHVVQCPALDLRLLDLLADGAGLFLGIPGGVDHARARARDRTAR